MGAMPSLAPGILRARDKGREARPHPPPPPPTPAGSKGPLAPGTPSPPSQAAWTHHPVFTNNHGHDNLVLEVQGDKHRWPNCRTARKQSHLEGPAPPDQGEGRQEPGLPGKTLGCHLPGGGGWGPGAGAGGWEQTAPTGTPPRDHLPLGLCPFSILGQGSRAGRGGRPGWPQWSLLL